MLAAGLAAWSSFLGAQRIEIANRDALHPAELVAEDEDGVVGMVSWDSASGEITLLYVHPRGQRRGAGAALLDRACAALRENGCGEAWLHTEARNAGARRFYEAQGWVVDGPPRVRNWLGAPLVEPRYVKKL